MKNYTVIPPKQNYMNLHQIYETYGTRPVIAYRCTVENNAPQGGYIIAVQSEADTPTEGIKAYMTQLRARFADKEPIYYMCVNKTPSGQLSVTYGGGRRGTNPAIPTPPKSAAGEVSEKELAKAVSSSLKENP